MADLLSCYPQHNPAVASRQVGEEWIIVVVETGEMRVVNEVGGRVWDLSDGTRTVREIISLVCQEFEVTADQATQDILDFLDELACRHTHDVPGASIHGQVALDRGLGGAGRKEDALYGGCRSRCRGGGARCGRGRGWPRRGRRNRCARWCCRCRHGGRRA